LALPGTVLRRDLFASSAGVNLPETRKSPLKKFGAIPIAMAVRLSAMALNA
jgi:hypothetical protein